MTRAGIVGGRGRSWTGILPVHRRSLPGPTMAPPAGTHGADDRRDLIDYLEAMGSAP